MSDDQLSRHERTVLETLEQSLEADDPAFVERFALEAQALDRVTSPRWAPLRWLHRRGHRNRGL
jgi:hypothetical protein